jgi:hypothetical protein
MKKCGNLDSALATQMAEQRAEDANFSRTPGFFGNYGSCADADASPALRVAIPRMGTPWPTLPSPDEDSGPQNMQQVDPIEVAYREAVQRARGVKASLSGMPPPRPHGPYGVPMAREVSLYKGLPNGWQYRHPDYASAHAEFMKAKGQSYVQEDDPGVRVTRPRVPSILPLWGPEHFMQEYPAQETNTANMLSMSSMSQQEVEDNASLHYLLLNHPPSSLIDFKEEPQSFGQQIDPMLLHLSAGCASQSSSNIEADQSSNQGANANNPSLSVPMSLKRAAAPQRLELDFSTGKAFTAYRNPLRDADATPDSPLMDINWDQAVNPSPTESDGSSSGGSQLSLFVVPPMSATTTVSPANSALRTPVDEFASETNEGEIIGEKGKVKIEPVVIELSDGIEQVCGL